MILTSLLALIENDNRYNPSQSQTHHPIHSDVLFTVNCTVNCTVVYTIKSKSKKVTEYLQQTRHAVEPRNLHFGSRTVCACFGSVCRSVKRLEDSTHAFHVFHG